MTLVFKEFSGPGLPGDAVTRQKEKASRADFPDCTAANWASGFYEVRSFRNTPVPAIKTSDHDLLRNHPVSAIRHRPLTWDRFRNPV